MVDVIKVQKRDNISLQIDCDKGIAMELDEFFSFFVPGYKFIPSYKNKVWDGKIRLFQRRNYQLPVGLYDHLQKFTKTRGYNLDLIEGSEGYPNSKNDVTPEEIYTFIQELNLNSKGKPIQVRSYQFEAIYHGINDKRRILLSPTGSGKSLIIYVLLRWFLATHDDKVLVVVPTTSLVEQMLNDFDDYSSHDETFSKEDCHTIFSGRPKTNIQQRVVISTWQSIFNLPTTWFDPFGCIVGDEVHGFKSKSLTSIMNKSRHASHRWGTTGTLDGTQVHELVLQGLFGRTLNVVTTKELQENDVLAQLDISILVLEHPQEIRKEFGKRTYQDEIDYIVRNEPRNHFVRNLALDLNGNTLILFQFVEKHGKPLYQDIIKNAKEGRKIFFVAGETESSDREAIRHIVETQKDSIIVASMGVFSTGINIRNLHNIIFPSPSKSQIRVLQSIGRGLRKSDNNQSTRLFDIVDDLHWKDRKNFAMLHGVHRMSVYDKQGFRYNIYKVKLD